MKDRCQTEHFLFELDLGTEWDQLPGACLSLSSAGDLAILGCSRRGAARADALLAATLVFYAVLHSLILVLFVLLTE